MYTLGWGSLGGFVQGQDRRQPLQATRMTNVMSTAVIPITVNWSGKFRKLRTGKCESAAMLRNMQSGKSLINGPAADPARMAI